MTNKIIIASLLLIVLIAAGIFAANATGMIDLKSMAANVPVLNKLIDDSADQVNTIPVSPIEEENKILRGKVADLEKKITELEADKVRTLEQVALTQKELTELRAYKTEKENMVLNAKEIALYYSQMKPEAVAKIMNTLDDDTVITILPLLDKDQSGKILSLLEPQRAALLTRIMLMGADNPANDKAE